MPPRLIRPKDEPDTSASSESLADLKLGKRKAVSTACIPCRKRKSKCDGAIPACSTCTAVYRTECAYDADSDHRRKGALKRDIQTLQQQNDALDVIVASLRTLPQEEAISLLHNLRSETSPDMLAAALRSNVRLPHSYAPQTLEADFADHISRSSSRPRIQTNDPLSHHSESTDDERSPAVERPATWFRQPQDAEFVHHLLNLYFCWVHPFYQLFSREQFLHDMSRGASEFCSALLVNAVLAAACHYSGRPSARTQPNDPTTAGDLFFKEAKRLLDMTEKPSLTTVQALGVMSLRETSQGRDSNGYQYAGRCVRMAVELGLHLSVVASGLRASDIEVRKITFWGVFNLETICSVGFGRLSQLPRAAADIQRPSIFEKIESQTWRPYEESSLSASPIAEQPLQPMLFMDQFSRLSELASDMVNTFYAPRERFTSRRLGLAYAQYRDWYQNLPTAFHLENTTLPHVIVLHMYYYACVLHLFRPYVKLDLSNANLYPRDICIFCANEISNLMSMLRNMYGLRRVCLAVTSLLLSASTIHLLNLPCEPSTTNLAQAMHDFHTMSVNHTFAARCMDIVRSLAAKWNITLPEDAASVFPFRPSGQRNQLSPTSSMFWAASIPRNESGKSTGSNSSRQDSSGQHESPFSPPNATQAQQQQQHHQQQQQQHFAPMFSDPAMQMDPNHMQELFWTPFPGQTMPVVPNISVEMTGMESDPAQWQMYTSGMNSHIPSSSEQQHSSGQQSMSSGNWQWDQHQQQQQQHHQHYGGS